jgi:V8-like Glu-specific endopeptidase
MEVVMHRSIRPLAVTTLAVAIASTTVLAVGAVSVPSAAAGSDPSQPVSAPTRLSAASEDAVIGYWTKERMGSAKPMKVTRQRGTAKVRQAIDPKASRAVRTASTDTQSAPATVQAAGDQPPRTYPFPFGRRSVEKQLRRVTPYRQVGRLFFRQNGTRYSCSGSSVVGGYRHVVYTAGHCLNNGAGVWSTDVVFVPGRRDGKSKNPYGTFAAKELWVPSGWVDFKWWAYDLGAFNVGKNKKGKTLRKAVGALGFAYLEGAAQHWDIFGYPALSPWKGNKLITCSTSWGYSDSNVEGPNSLGVGCDMTNGSSGGPWILGLRRRNLLNGVTSYGYPDEPDAIYSPYFDLTANKIRCAAGTGKPDKDSC